MTHFIPLKQFSDAAAQQAYAWRLIRQGIALPLGVWDSYSVWSNRA